MNIYEPETRTRILASDPLNPNFRSHLRLVDVQDAEFICALRSDPALNLYLSAARADIEAQRNWIASYKEREVQGKEFYFIIRCDGENVGVVRLYDLKLIGELRSFSWGSWIIRPPRPPGIVTFSAAMMYELGFDVLKFDRAHFEVLRGNTGVSAFHQRAGALIENALSDRFEYGFWPGAWQTFRELSRAQIADHRREVERSPCD